MSSKDEKKVEKAEEAEAKASSQDGTQKDAELTCDVLCSLSGCSPPPPDSEEACPEEACEKKGKKSKSCPKQHQLPMFLSSKYCCMWIMCSGLIIGGSFQEQLMPVVTVIDIKGSYPSLYRCFVRQNVETTR